MEMETLKAQWAAFDQKLDAGLQMNRAAMRESMLHKSQSALQRLTSGVVIELFVGLAVLLLLALWLVLQPSHLASKARNVAKTLTGQLASFVATWTRLLLSLTTACYKLSTVARRFLKPSRLPMTCFARVFRVSLNLLPNTD